MDDLAAAFQRRGKLYHSEMNAPVYASLQALATIVSVRSSPTVFPHSLTSSNPTPFSRSRYARVVLC